MTGHPVFRVLHETLDVLEREGVECALMGGFAVRHWALPRPTYDVDFAIAADGQALQRLLRALEEAEFTVERHHLAGFADELAGMSKVAVGRFVDGSVWRVDLFLDTSPLIRAALRRALPATIEGRTCSVVSAEDLLLMKLLAYRTRDRADVEDLLLLCGALDEAYLREWATRLSIADRLEAALRARRAE